METYPRAWNSISTHMIPDQLNSFRRGCCWFKIEYLALAVTSSYKTGWYSKGCFISLEHIRKGLRKMVKSRRQKPLCDPVHEKRRPTTVNNKVQEFYDTFQSQNESSLSEFSSWLHPVAPPPKALFRPSTSSHQVHIVSQPMVRGAVSVSVKKLGLLQAHFDWVIVKLVIADWLISWFQIQFDFSAERMYLSFPFDRPPRPLLSPSRSSDVCIQ